MQLTRIGDEKMTLMKSPLESKYCCLENRCQFFAATSFRNSEQYTSTTENDFNELKFSNVYDELTQADEKNHLEVDHVPAEKAQ